MTMFRFVDDTLVIAGNYESLQKIGSIGEFF